jgi:hypothetical protein
MAAVLKNEGCECDRDEFANALLDRAWGGGGGRLGPPADARDVSRARAQRALRLSGRRRVRRKAALASSPSACGPTTGPSPASGRSGRRMSCSTGPAGASPSACTRATPISCSRRERASRFPFASSSTARLPARHTASTSTRTGTACSETAACTSSCAEHDRVRERTPEITFLEAGAEAYVFTFARYGG